MNNPVTLFEQKNMMAFLELRNIENQEKKLKERKDAIRNIITEGMEANGIQSIDNEYVNIVYVKKTFGTPMLDEKAWRASDPEGYNRVFEKYSKMSGAKKAYVRIKTK